MAMRVKSAQSGYTDGKGRFHATGKKVRVSKKNPLPKNWTPAKVMRDVKGGIKVLLDKRRNPAAFDRCVKAVGKRGGVGSAYAVCKAAGAGKKKNRRRKR